MQILVVFPLQHFFLISAMGKHWRKRDLRLREMTDAARGRGDKMMPAAGPFDALLDLQVLEPQTPSTHEKIATCRVDGVCPDSMGVG